MQVHDSIARFAAIATSCGSLIPWQSLNRLTVGYRVESDAIATSCGSLTPWQSLNRLTVGYRIESDATATSCGSLTPWQSLNRLTVGYRIESDAIATSCGSLTPWQSLNRLTVGYRIESDIALSCRRACVAHDRQYQVICRRGCRLSVMFTSHYVQKPAVEPVYRSHHRSIEGPGLAAVCTGRAHTDSVQLQFGCSR